MIPEKLYISPISQEEDEENIDAELMEDGEEGEDVAEEEEEEKDDEEEEEEEESWGGDENE